MAGIKIPVSGVTFQGKGETQNRWAQVPHVASRATDLLHHLRLRHRQIRELHPVALLLEKKKKQNKQNKPNK